LFFVLLVKSIKKDLFILLAFLKKYKDVFNLVKAAKLKALCDYIKNAFKKG
jgi:hypothetical protein